MSLSVEEVRQYRVKGEETLELAWKTLNNDKWTVEKELNTGDQVYKQKFSGQTIFKLKAIINASTSELFEILYKRVEETPMWNPTLKESKIIQEVDDSTDILYQITGEIGGGVISSRDFVILRHWQRKYGHLIIANVSVTSPCTPKPKKIIRGENGVGCWALKDLGDSRTQLLWLLNTNIKGWVPKYAVNANLMTVMTEFMDHLRKRIMDSSSLQQTS